MNRITVRLKSDRCPNCVGIRIEEDAGKKRIRGIYIVKSRGMGHSSDVHKLILSDDGIALVPMDPVEGPKQKEKVDTGVSEKQNMAKALSGQRGA